MHKSVTIQKHSSKLRSAAAKGRPGPGCTAESPAVVFAMDSNLSTSSDDDVLVAAAAWLLNRIRRLYLELVQLSRYDNIFSW